MAAGYTPNARPGAGPVGQGDYLVQSGDCLDSIACHYGHYPKTIWDAGENAELRRQRGSPNVLLPGDHLHVPPLRVREQPGATEQKHRFRRKGVPARLQIRLVDAGNPRANEPFQLQVDGLEISGRTDGDGWIRVEIPPDAREGILVVGSDPLRCRRHNLMLGGMDPVTEIIGVQQRLHNLGYPCDASGDCDEPTRSAITAFQIDNEIEPSGQADDELRRLLLERHGS